LYIVIINIKKIINLYVKLGIDIFKTLRAKRIDKIIEITDIMIALKNIRSNDNRDGTFVDISFTLKFV
jgi:hypothetical protein